jgi:hypothetical protein
MRGLVTRWCKAGWLGRSGPRACELQVSRVPGKLVVSIEQGNQRMLLILDADNAKALAWKIITECKKLPK